MLGHHTEAVLAYQESIPLRNALVAIDPGQRKHLMAALHNLANSFHILGRDAEAGAAANEALRMNWSDDPKTLHVNHILERD